MPGTAGSDRLRHKKALDPASLKALSHPLRAELFRALQDGPATSTHLAKRVGGSTGTVSWHLRELARFGFIEDEPERGNGRERWWRVIVPGTTLDIRDEGIADDPVTLAAARWFARDSLRVQNARAEHWVATAESWPQEWIGASFLREDIVALTPAQLLALQRDIDEVIGRHRVPPGENPYPHARTVHLAMHAFPDGEPGARPAPTERDYGSE